MEKKLYRSRNDKMIAGVAGGIAEYFEIDPVIVRALFVVAGLADGAGVLIYIVLAIILPENPTQAPMEQAQEKEVGDQSTANINTPSQTVEAPNRRPLLGGILIFLGGLFLLHNLFPEISVSLGQYWPVLIIALGFFLLFRNR